MVKKLGTTVAVALLMATSACAASRPSGSDLSSAIQKGVTAGDQKYKLAKDQADCAAKVFEKSDLSDESLKAIADRNSAYKESAADKKALEKILPELQKCT